MKRCLWIHKENDPLRSGELRRLGLPALLLEGGGWVSVFKAAAAVGRTDQADVVVCALSAANVLSETPGSAHVLIEVDSGCLEGGHLLGPVLHGLANRIAGVVARSPRVAQWVERVLADASVPMWTIPDCAARPAELRATQLRFGHSSSAAASAPIFPQGYDLWFAEPGDAVSEDQIEPLSARDRSATPLVVVAPPEIRIWLEQAGVRFTGHDWSPSVLEAAVAHADRCVFHGQSTYAQLRRAGAAFRLGGRIQLADGAPLPEQTPASVGLAWLHVLNELQPQTSASYAGADAGVALFFADLVQDVDLILPLLDEYRQRSAPLKMLISAWLQKRSPRLCRELEGRGISAEVLSREAILEGDAPLLEGVGAVISPAESSLPAHSRAHNLFQRARARRIPTFSIQHGVENVGLSDADADMQDAWLLSDHLFVWAPPQPTALPGSAALRPRVRHVGRAQAPPAPVEDLRGALANFRSVVTVFENLHWSRYSRAFRNQFLSDCLEFAAADPERCVLLKPHHAGLWSVRHTHLFPQWPQNLVLADPADGYWEPFTAPSLMSLANLVITTPSTVALDAAVAGKPVAVASYGLSLPAYAPLTLLHSLQDWLSFAAGVASRPIADAKRRAGFVARTAWGERPVEDMVDYIIEVMRERASARSRGSLV